MAKKTYINQLQNPVSYQEYVEKYLDGSLNITSQNLNALANSGQRFGISADGIIYKSVSLKDIFTNINNPQDYVLEIQEINSQIQYILKNKKTFEPYETSELNNFKYSNILYLEDNPELANLLLDLQLLNHYEKIDPLSFIVYDNNKLTLFLKCLNNSYSDDGASLIYIQYNTITNKLEHYILTEYFGIYHNYDAYICYKLDLTNNDTYKLQINIFDLHILSEIISSLYNQSLNKTITADIYSILHNFYTYIEVNNIFDTDEFGNHENKLFSLFNSTYANYNLLNINSNILNLSDLRNISFLHFIINNNFRESYLLDNPDNERYLMLFSDIYIKSSQDNSNIFEYDMQNSSDVVFENISDITLNNYLLSIIGYQTVYSKIFSFYSIEKYSSNIETLYMNIFIKIYKDINKMYSKNLNSILYIPLDVSIHCIMNDNLNVLNIYYSNNIYINFINSLDNLSGINNITYYSNNCINHTSVYNFEFIYNTKYKNLVNDININKLYTLPYINALNNWVLNEDETEYVAYEDKNIGIKQLYLYCKKEDINFNTEVLNISEDMQGTYFTEFKTVQFNINPKLFSSEKSISSTCYTQVPVITSDNKEFFKNTVIVSINSTDNIITSTGEPATNYILNYVYSLWKFNDDKFECVTLDNTNIAFDPFNNLSLEYMNNTNERVVYALIVPKNNKADKSNIQSDNYYALMYNKVANNYVSNNTTGLYENDYNYAIEYLANIHDTENGFIKSEYNTNDDRYITNISNTKVTNVIYPKYDVKYYTYSTYREVYDKLSTLQLNYKTYISIHINDTSNTVITEIADETELTYITKFISKYVTENKQVEIGIFLDKNNEFYNEYVFNQNVPTMDLKEVFVRNTNQLNRTNIIGVDTTNNDNTDTTVLYNGYIGTSVNDEHKDTMYISTSNENINVGIDTLMGINQYNKFSKFKTLCIDGFDNFDINVKQITTNRPIINEFNYPEVNRNIQSFSIIANGLLDEYNFMIFGNSKYIIDYENNPEIIQDNNEYPYLYYTLFSDTLETDNINKQDSYKRFKTFINIQTIKKQSSGLEGEVINLFSGINLNQILLDNLNIDINEKITHINENNEEEIINKYILDRTYNYIIDVDTYYFLLINNIFDTVNNVDPYRIYNHKLNICMYNIGQQIHIIINFDSKEHDQLSINTSLPSYAQETIQDFINEHQTIVNYFTTISALHRKS